MRGELLSWLMFVATGVGPFSGQAVHFKHFAPKPVPYAHERYQYEAKRHFGVLDARLADRRYVVGDAYTIVDMAVWGWARMVPFIIGEESWASLPNLKRHFDEINARPAAQRASPSRTSTPSRPRWTRTRAATCSGTLARRRRKRPRLRQSRRMTSPGPLADRSCTPRAADRQDATAQPRASFEEQKDRARPRRRQTGSDLVPGVSNELRPGCVLVQ